MEEALLYMMELEGWKILRSQVEKKIQYHKDQLLSCPLDEVEKHRLMIEAMKYFLAAPDEILTELGG